MWKQKRKKHYLILILAVFAIGLSFSHKATAAAGINQQMAFEGKIVLSNGTNITNGNYNLEFKIYNGGTSGGGGTLQWTEDYLVGGSGGVTMNNGTFAVNLGSITSLSSVNWNSDTLWLSLQVGNTSSCTITTTFQSNCGGDGEMSPYIRLTSVPYAFNALELGGVIASSYGQLANNQTWTGINTFNATGGNAVAITGLPTNVATSSLLQLGSALQGGNTSINGGTYLSVNEPGSGGGSAADLLNLQNNGNSLLQLTSGGNVRVGNTTLNSTLGVVGTSIFKSATGNSTTAFQVQNAAGSNLLTADTVNQALSVIGNGQTAAPVLSAGSNTGGQLSGGNTYYYRVSAIVGGSETPPSPEASLTPVSFTPISAPATAPTATAATGSGLGIGTYRYQVTYTTQHGETTGSTATSVTTSSGNQAVNLTNIPTGPTGTFYREIYRTAVNGSAGSEKWLAQLADNTTTSYTDTNADTNLGQVIPTTNGAIADANQINVSFTAVPNATSYRIYRGTASGAESSYQTAPSSPFTDSGAITGYATPPPSPTSTLAVVGGLKVTNATSCVNLITDASGNVSCGSNLMNQISEIEVSGHSYAVGGGASNIQTTAWGPDLASMTHAQLLNHAVGGAVAAWSNGVSGTPGNGGYASVLQNLGSYRTAAPYLPRPGLGVIWYGLNDLGALGPSNMAPFQSALTTIIARYRSSAVFEETDSSVSFQAGGGAAWTPVSGSTTVNSGSGYETVGGNGNTVTVKVPADFPGGEVDLGFVTAPSGGSLMSFTVDGSGSGSLDLRSQAAPSHDLGMVKRLTGLTPGAHTIVAMVSNYTGFTAFDYWQIEAPTPRPILVPLASRVFNYTIWNTNGPTWIYQPGDSDIPTLSTTITNITNQFDNSVLPVNIDNVMNKDLVNFYNDLVHPNDQGHAKIAAAMYNALGSMQISTNQLAVSSSLPSYTNGSVNFQNWMDSTTALQIQNAAGTYQLLNADTTNGRIGIGTSAPAYTVDVRGDGTTTTVEQIFSGSSSQSTGLYLGRTSIDGVSAIAGTSASYSTLAGVGDYIQRALTGNLILESNYGNIDFTTGAPDSIKLAITHSGNINIGASGTATGQLYVSGTIPGAAVGSISTGTNAQPHSVYVQGSYAYVANYIGNTIQIYDVRNPSAPVLIGSAATGTAPASVYVQGRYAYVANFNASTLQIFDVSNPASPVSVGSVNTYSGPFSVYVQGRYAYVANVYTGLQIFDVSNPASPVSVGFVATAAGSNPESVYVQGRYAYLAEYGSNNIQIFDVSNPTNPVSVGTVSTGASSNPQSVYVQGRYAYVTNKTGNTLKVFDVSNPTNPVSVGTVSTGASSNPQSVYVQGRYAYVTNYGGSTFQIFDVSNPASPVSVGTVATDGGPSSVYIQGRYAYVTNQGANTLQMFDLGGEYTQQLQAGGAEVGSLQVDTNAQIFGDANVQGGLSTGGSIQANGNLGVGGNSYLQGTLAVAGGVQGGLTINGLATPAAPTITPSPAGTTAYSYKIVAVNSAGGLTPASSVGSTTTGPATLNTSNYNVISWSSIPGATSYKVYRTASSGTPNTTGVIALTNTTTILDTGLAGDSTVPAITDTSGTLSVTNAATIGTGLTVTSGGATVTAGGLNVTAGTTSLGGTLIVTSGATFNGGIVDNGQLVQTYSSGTSNSASSITVTNTNATATATTVSGETLSLIGSTNANVNANTINGINFATVTPVSNNTFNGLTFGTGYTNLVTSANFSIAAAGNITNSGTYNGNTFTSSGLTFSAGSANTISGTSGQSLTVQSQGSGQLTLSSGSGTLSLASGINVVQRTATGITTLDLNDSGTTSLVLDNTGVGVANLVLDNGSLQTGSTPTTRLDNSGNLTNIGTIGASGLATLSAGATLSGTTLVQSGALALLTADTSNNKVQIGSATTDTTQVNLQVDSSSNYADSGTCATTTNQGAMYYNTASAAMRACINSAWEDMISTSGLGILAFGVVPDSGNAGTPGDIAGVSGYTKSPCKVTWLSANSVQVNPCAVYSGGRKILVGTTTVSTASLAASTYANICFSTNTGGVTTTGVPTLLNGSITETSATVPTFSANNPVECLATVKTTGTAGTVGNIWDTRTFTNTQKEFIAINSVNALGYLLIGSATADAVVTTTTAGTGPIAGVVVASSGTASSAAINGIIAISGHAFIKVPSTTPTDTINTLVETTTTAGYMQTVASNAAATVYAYAGILERAADTTCTAATNCQYSGLTRINISR